MKDLNFSFYGTIFYVSITMKRRIRMEVIAAKITTSTETQSWLIDLKSSVDIQTVSAVYKQQNQFIHPAKSFELKTAFADGFYQIEVPFALLSKQSLHDRKTNWTFLCHTSRGEAIVQTNDISQVDTLKDADSFFEFEFNLSTSKLILVATPKPFQAILETFTLTKNGFSGSGSIQADAFNWARQNLKLQLVIKRRPNPTLYNYFEHVQKFELFDIKNQNFSFDISFDRLDYAFLVDDLNNLDCFLVVKTAGQESHPMYLDLAESLKNNVDQTVFPDAIPYTSISFYKTGSNRLAFYFIKKVEQEVQIQSFSESSKELSFKFESQHSLKNGKFVLKRRDKKFLKFEYLEELIFPFKTNWLSSYHVKVNKANLFPFDTFKPYQIWDAFIRLDGFPDFPVYVPESIQFENKLQTAPKKAFDFKLAKMSRNNLYIRIAPSPTSKGQAKNIAVLGTCFSRNAFNSSPYFNPEYKSFFHVALTQMHSSLISIMTEDFDEKVDFNKYKDEITHFDMTYMKDDFKKDFFKRLKKAKPDYFIIDLYADAIRPVMWLNDKTAITFSYIVEGSHIADDLPCHRMMTHLNDEEFFNEWTHYADRFIEELTTIIPENRIILNKGGFTCEYYDEVGKKTVYPNKMAIQKAQYLWDRLNNYFLLKAPNVRVIDFTNKGYIGDYYYPFGHSFSHFESDYYKDFLKEMIYIDQTDRLL